MGFTLFYRFKVVVVVRGVIGGGGAEGVVNSPPNLRLPLQALTCPPHPASPKK